MKRVKNIGSICFIYLYMFIISIPDLVEAGSGVFIDSAQKFGTWQSFGVSLGDVDGDGDLDAFIANASFPGNPNTVFLNNGSGTFTDSGQKLGNFDSTAVSLGDLDGDGDLDAFVAEGTMLLNTVWLNNGLGSFIDSGQRLRWFYGYDVPLGDVDGDGDLDAFVVSPGPNLIWVNDGSGVFYDSGQRLGGSDSYGVFLGDVDEDGDLDAFVANGTSAPNMVWLNDGSGVFYDSGQRLGGSDSYSVFLGDVDGDSDLDAFVINQRAPSTVWLNDRSGVFYDSGQRIGSSKTIGEDVSLGDVDGDGDLDAIIVGVYIRTNTVMLNDGSGSFASSAEYYNIEGNDVSLGDVDGDGDLDVFVTSAGWRDESISIWLNVPGCCGKVVVNNDEWTLSDQGFNETTIDAVKFALNIGNYFTDGKPGNFLVYSTPFGSTNGLVGDKLKNTMESTGHSWTIISNTTVFTIADLLQYDGIFLAGSEADNFNNPPPVTPPDTQIMIDYVKAGGNIYIAGGTDPDLPAQEANQWNLLLNACGLKFETIQNDVYGIVPVNSNHPLFEGVQELFQRNGNSISKLDPSDTRASILVKSQDEGLYAICSFTELEPWIVNDKFRLGNTFGLGISDADGACGSGYEEIFTYRAALVNKSSESLSNIIVQVNELTNNNKLLNADGGPGGVGAILTVPTELLPRSGNDAADEHRNQEYLDGILATGEEFVVDYKICLKNLNPFRFYIDVLGIVE